MAKAGRAWRRHHYERMKRKVRWHYCLRERHPESDPRLLGRYARTRQVCSCYMCGNPRRHFQALTMQEMKADDAHYGEWGKGFKRRRRPGWY